MSNYEKLMAEYEIEIIGNIHDTPELLEVSNDD
jgi:hypothetical protein